MLKLFRRWSGAASKPPAPARPLPQEHRPWLRDPLDIPTQPAGLPEVVAEGNDHTDWSLWEDSVHAIDSQLQSILPSDRVYVRDTQASQLDELDAFARVGKNREL